MKFLIGCYEKNVHTFLKMENWAKNFFPSTHYYLFNLFREYSFLWQFLKSVKFRARSESEAGDSSDRENLTSCRNYAFQSKNTGWKPYTYKKALKNFRVVWSTIFVNPVPNFMVINLSRGGLLASMVSKWRLLTSNLIQPINQNPRFRLWLI